MTPLVCPFLMYDASLHVCLSEKIVRLLAHALFTACLRYIR